MSNPTGGSNPPPSATLSRPVSKPPRNIRSGCLPKPCARTEPACCRLSACARLAYANGMGGWRNALTASFCQSWARRRAEQGSTGTSYPFAYSRPSNGWDGRPGDDLCFTIIHRRRLSPFLTTSAPAWVCTPGNPCCPRNRQRPAFQADRRVSPEPHRFSTEFSTGSGETAGAGLNEARLRPPGYARGWRALRLPWPWAGCRRSRCRRRAAPRREYGRHGARRCGGK